MNYLHRRGKYGPLAEAPRPGLILLDLNMPKKDGREALREIKSDPELRQISVVVLTTSKAEEDIYSSYDSGASSFISKPVTFEGLVNVMAPLALVQDAWPHLAEHAVIINVSSDAAADHYEGWGGYGGSKAALDHQTLTWAAEEPQHRWYAVDPGDMRTAMHQAAFPGEDIGDRPEPESIAPTIAALVASGLPSGRYRAADLAESATAAAEARA